MTMTTTTMTEMTVLQRQWLRQSESGVYLPRLLRVLPREIPLQQHLEPLALLHKHQLLPQYQLHLLPRLMLLRLRRLRRALCLTQQRQHLRHQQHQQQQEQQQ